VSSADTSRGKVDLGVHMDEREGGGVGRQVRKTSDSRHKMMVKMILTIGFNRTGGKNNIGKSDLCSSDLQM